MVPAEVRLEGVFYKRVSSYRGFDSIGESGFIRGFLGGGFSS